MAPHTALSGLHGAHSALRRVPGLRTASRSRSLRLAASTSAGLAVVDRFTPGPPSGSRPRLFSSTPPPARDLGAKYRRPRITDVDIVDVTATGPVAGTPHSTSGLAAGPSQSPSQSPSPSASSSMSSVPAAPEPPPPAAQRGPVMVAGVRVPPKPIAPGPEDCCMSGCVHCVLTMYAEDLEEYTTAVDAARTVLEAKGVPRMDWPDAVTQDDERDEGEVGPPPPADPTMAAFMALEAKIQKKKPEKKKAAPAMDPTIAAFMALEKKIRNKNAP